jgi:hypothetical protein
MACVAFMPLNLLCGRARTGVENCSREQLPACKVSVFNGAYRETAQVEQF